MNELTTKQKVARMIEHTCEHDSLTNLCEYYGVTVGDFYDFISAGLKEDSANK